MIVTLRLYNRKALPHVLSRIARLGMALGALLVGACSSGDRVAGLGPIPTGSLAIGIDGLPPGVLGAVVVTGSQGYQKNVTTGQTLSGLTPGTYAIAASEITSDGDRYTAAPATQNVAVTSGVVPVTTSVSYQLMTGRLAVSVSGLPAAANATVPVSGPGGYTHTVVASETLTGLVPGNYTVQSPTLVLSGDRYDAQATAQDIVIAAIPGTTGLVAVNYSVASGALSVVVEGLPAGANAVIGVSGPQGFHADLAASATLSGLEPGNYSISAGNVSAGGKVFLPSLADQSASVSPSLVPVVRTVTYTQANGSLNVTVAGLPGAVLGSVTVSGPGGFLQSITATQALTSLVPGTYTVSAFSVSSGPTTYVPVPVSQNVTVGIGATASAGVTYTALAGSLQLTVSGLPGGAVADINVTGPGAFSQHVTGSQTLSGLQPGTYTISAAAVASGGSNYLPVPVSQTSNVIGGAGVNVSVVYASSAGGMNLTIGGLPGGVLANVTVTGPGSFSQFLTTSQTLSGLVPGTYMISSAAVVNAGTTYSPSPPVQSVSVSAGAVAPASVFYTGGGGGGTLNLTVNGVYLTQATQRYDGSVPLVAGRNAYLRVFALANQVNSAQPQVRVRLYNGASLVQTYTIRVHGRTAASVPVARRR